MKSRSKMTNAFIGGVFLVIFAFVGHAGAFPGANGKIAFRSNRDGNWEIYVMNDDGTGQTRLTTNSAVDTLPSWSADGTKIAFASNRDGNFEIFVMDDDGSNQTQLTFTSPPTSNYQPSWSPDGTKIAFVSDRVAPGVNAEIYVMNDDGTNQTRLTTNSAVDARPFWSPDGTKIAFSSYRDGNWEIYVMNDDGTSQTRLTTNPALDVGQSWSPDGTKIAFRSDRDGNPEVYVMNDDGTSQTRLTTNPADDHLPSWSPDGTKIAFQSGRDGNAEVYVMNDDGTGQTNLSNDSAEDGEPDWQPLPIELPVDIKPHSCPNPLNTKSKGVLPVAILGTEYFDVNSVDPSTVQVEGVGPIRSDIEDVSAPVMDRQDECDCTIDGPDGFDDLSLKFDTQEIVAALGAVNDGDEVVLTLTGFLIGGLSLEGMDCIVIK